MQALDPVSLSKSAHHLTLDDVKISSELLMNLLTPSKTATAAREERLAAAAEAKLRESRAASETLRQRTSEASDQRKAIARQKIQQLKAQLQMLQSMSSTDPKGTARVAARLARELGAAVKAYAAAGVTGAGMDAGASAAAPPASPSPVDAVQTPSGEGEVQDAVAAKGAEPGASDDASGKSTNPYQQAIDEQKTQAADLARRGAEKQADAEFMAEVRELAARIRQLVRQATEKAGQDAGLPPEEARELKGVVADMDRDIATAEADLGGGISLLI